MAFAVFAFCWALSGLLDLAPVGELAHSPLHALYSVSCLVVLLWPRSLAAFGAMNAMRILVFCVQSPVTPNHHVHFALASAAILAALPFAARQAGGLRQLTPEGWARVFAPVLRVSLLVLYFFAVLHKLNWDYLDPAVSCGVEILLVVLPQPLSAAVAERPALHPLLVYGSLAAEVAIPVLLALSRTRRLGLLLGVLFHSFLGIRFYAFSTGLLGLYSLFVPAAVFAGAAAGVARWRGRSTAARWLLSAWTPRALALLMVGGLATIGGRLVEVDSVPLLYRRGYPAFSALWVAGSFGALALLLWVREGRSRWSEPVPGMLAGTSVLLVFPLLIALNGFSPYLGLRTVPTFSMFSNLRTEGGITNHVFMPPRALRISGVQDDLVTLLDADDPGLRRFAQRPRRTFYDLQRRVQQMAERGKTGIRLVYRRGDRRVAVLHAERDPALMEPIPWWKRKLLRFRPVPVSTQRACSW